MELDAEYIKKNFKMQLPVKAKVTSSYGKREEDKIVSADHYGIDLGVDYRNYCCCGDGRYSYISIK